MGELQIRYSDKSVSPWGGMYLLKEFMDRSGIFSKLEELDLPRPGSNAGYTRSSSCRVSGWGFSLERAVKPSFGSAWWLTTFWPFSAIRFFNQVHGFRLYGPIALQ